MSADCCLVYASVDDFDNAGIPAAATANVGLDKIQSALTRASRMSDTYLRDRYQLPLRCPVDPTLTQWVCWIAVYMVMGVRGYNPNLAQVDTLIRMNYDDALKGLLRVANGQQQLCVNQTAPGSDQPMVGTSPGRGLTPDGVDPNFVGPNTWGN